MVRIIDVIEEVKVEQHDIKKGVILPSVTFWFDISERENRIQNQEKYS
jgi:hypothetical protein